MSNKQNNFKAKELKQINRYENLDLGRQIILFN